MHALALSCLGVVVAVAVLFSPLRPQGGDTVPGRLAMVTLACEGRSNLISIEWLRVLAESHRMPYYAQVTNEGLAVVSIFGPGPGWLSSPFFSDVPRGKVIDDQFLRVRARWAACSALVLSALLLALGLTAITSLRWALIGALTAALSFAGASSLGQALWQQTAALPWYIASIVSALWARRFPGLLAWAAILAAWACWLRPADAALGIAAIMVAWNSARAHVTSLLVVSTALVGVFVVSIALGSWYFWYFDKFMPIAQWSANQHVTDAVFQIRPVRILTGIAGLLLSPGRGLLIFAPITLVALWSGVRRGRSFQTNYPLLVAIALELCIYGAFHKWWGGVAFGPRLLATSVWFSIPLLFTGVESWSSLHRVVVAGAVAQTVLVGLLGLSAYDVRKWEFPNDPDHHPERLFSLQNSQWSKLFRPTPRMGEVVDAPAGPFRYCAPLGLRNP